MNRLLYWLREPVDGASLAVFRIAFGAILLWDVFRYWLRIQRLFLDSQGNPGGGFQFKYYGWEWVPALPGHGMYLLFGVIGLASLGIDGAITSVIFYIPYCNLPGKNNTIATAVIYRLAVRL